MQHTLSVPCALGGARDAILCKETAFAAISDVPSSTLESKAYGCAATQCMVGDCTIEWELPDGGLYIMPSRHGAAAAFPEPGKNNFRLVRAACLACNFVFEDAACKSLSSQSGIYGLGSVFLVSQAQKHVLQLTAWQLLKANWTCLISGRLSPRINVALHDASLHLTLSAAQIQRTLTAELRLRAQVMIVPNEDIATERHIDRETFEGYLKRMMPYKYKLVEARFLSRYRLHHRCADAFRSGRAFLAGDAAHVHSPVGGQGMNTGIQARSVWCTIAVSSPLPQHVCVVSSTWMLM